MQRVYTVDSIKLAPGFSANWGRLQRDEDPLPIAVDVLNDPEGVESYKPGGLPLSWRQRLGRSQGARWRLVYLWGAEGDRAVAHVSYLSPV